MLKTNWTMGSAPLTGRAYAIRQRLGRAKPAKSVAPHKFMSSVERTLLADRLEKRAEREWRAQMGG